METGPQPVPDDAAQFGLVLPTSDAPLDWVRFIDETNLAMQRLFQTGSSLTQEELRDRIRQISEYKVQAADKLIALPEVPPESLKAGKQAKLEGLSQLAGMQSTDAAEALEKYADELTQSDDPRLHFNGRVVKLGFLIDRLISGQLKEPKPLEDAVMELTKVPELLDAPSAMTLNEVYMRLGQYGFDASSRRVREMMILAFEKNGDPQLLEFAANLTGNMRFDEISRLVHSASSGQTVPPSEMRAAASKVAREFPDIVTLNYLNSTALQYEAKGNEEFAETLYEVIAGDLMQGAPQEVAAEATAIAQARVQRRKIVGHGIVIEGMDLDKIPIQWDQFRGSVVVVPFWSTRSDNVGLLQALQALEAKHGDRIKILGVNLDTDDAPILAYVREAKIRFPSVRQTDPSKQGLRDPLVHQVGMASQPFVLVVNPKGEVSSIVLDIQRLDALVTP